MRRIIMARAKKDYIEQWFHKADEDIAVFKKLISDIRMTLSGHLWVTQKRRLL